MPACPTYNYDSGVSLMPDAPSLVPVGSSGTDPYSFIQEIQGSILIETDDDSTEVPDIAIGGRYEALYVDLDAARQEGMDAHQLFECYGESLSHWHGYLFSENYRLRTSVALAAKLDRDAAPSLFLLNLLILQGEHRGRGVGIDVLKTLIRRERRGAGLAALAPMPLQFSPYYRQADRAAEWDLGHLAKRFDTSRDKLVHLYGNAGFVPVDDGRLMVRRGPAC